VTRTMPTLDLRIGPEIRKFIDAVNATGDPRRDNERVLEHLAAEVDPFRVLELNKDRERRRPESPWDTLHIEELVIDVIRLCHWHYLETENPLFVFRAIEFGLHLTIRNAHYLDWTQKYLLTAAASLARLVARPPAAEDAETALATALEIRSARMASRSFPAPPTRPFQETAPAGTPRSCSWRRCRLAISSGISTLPPKLELS